MKSSSRFCSDYFNDYLLAGRIDTDPETLKRLSTSRIDEIRVRVAENSCTPASILHSLARDECADVRAAVALNARCHKEVRRSLVQDPDPTVRYAIAEDPNMQREFLLLLSGDANPYVAVRARKTLALQPKKTPSISRCLAGRGMLKLAEGAISARTQQLRFA